MPIIQSVCTCGRSIKEGSERFLRLDSHIDLYVNGDNPCFPQGLGDSQDLASNYRK